MVKQSDLHRYGWPMSRITGILPDAAGVVKTVEVEVGGIRFIRSVTFIVPLELGFGGEAAMIPGDQMTINNGSEEEENYNNLDGHPFNETGEETGNDDVNTSSSYQAAAQAMPATPSRLSTSSSDSAVRLMSADWEDIQSDEREPLLNQPEGRPKRMVTQQQR